MEIKMIFDNEEINSNQIENIKKSLNETFNTDFHYLVQNIKEIEVIFNDN